MSENTKIWLLTMLHNEIEEVNGTISNNRIWAKGSDTFEDVSMYEDNIADLEEYKQTLEELKNQIEEGTFNV